MADSIDQVIKVKGKETQIIDLRPTLYIGVGGTGMEVLMRVRRRILNALWGSAGQRKRVDNLAEFPVAQFIQFDLDNGALIDSGRSRAEDLQFNQVKFSDDDKIVEGFDMEKYSRDDDALEKYPHVKEWLSLTPKKIRDLGIDPSKGAGQIRAVSRLYLFDKYTKLRDKIRLKLKSLQTGLSYSQQLAELGLRMETGRFRIVVVGSVAGGTGSGAFLDMGYLARWLARSEVGHADVELMLFMPSGYANAGKSRTEANGYAALMELESAMMGNTGYIGRWDPYDQPELPREPYNEVYLIDSGNVAQQHTKNISDVYQMVADSLFEDFASADFANNKRSVAVNQAKHKNSLYNAPVPQNRFGDMKLWYAKRFSGLGMAILDTRLEASRDERAHRWAGEMLKAFFGVGSGDLGANRATDKQRDEFMSTHMLLSAKPFSDFPEFSDKNIELKRSSGEFNDYAIVDELLQDKNGALLAGVEQRVSARIDEIRSGFPRDEWATQVREAVKQMERDAVRDQDSTADTTEDRVSKKRRELLEVMKQRIRSQLYAYLDNKEFGGLEYVLSLVEQIKDRLEAGGTGLVAALTTNAERYREIKDAVRSYEYERLLNNLAQTKGGFFGSGEKQAASIMDHLRTEISNTIKFHLRAKAADDAVVLMNELSAWLGRKSGVDAQGAPTWSGLVGELQAGRESVIEMLAQLQRLNTVLQVELQKEHATLITLPMRQAEVPMPSAVVLRDWADEAFKDIGGSKVIFPMLVEPKQRQELLQKVKRMADLKIAVTNNAQTADPLFEALGQMTPTQRMEYFRKLLACAMPWMDANLRGDFVVNSEQYQCMIGVAGANEFSTKYLSELQACLPTHSGITSDQLSIRETGVQGRMVCYCELSGVPMTVLRGLETWRTSYRKEAERTPTHTHIDSTQFSHPLAPSTEEINRLAEDFKQFLLAVMLGVLSRVTQRVKPSGQYQFAVGRGDTRRIGNERAIRQNGLPLTYRAAIVTRVQERLDELDGMQVAALATLADFYQSDVYTPYVVADESGAETDLKSFAYAMAGEAKTELRERARRKGLSDDELAAMQRRFLADIKSWAAPIGDSDADAYDWEVRQPTAEQLPRLKYAIRADVFDTAALAVVARGVPAAVVGQAAAFAAGALPPVAAVPPPLSPMVPPPLVPAQPAFQYHLGINGQQYGPYTAQQIGQMVQQNQVAPAATKVWREGLQGWADLHQFAELAPALVPPAPPPLSPSLPPPL
jgi:hypothetical protein